MACCRGLRLTEGARCGALQSTVRSVAAQIGCSIPKCQQEKRKSDVTAAACTDRTGRYWESQCYRPQFSMSSQKEPYHLPLSSQFVTSCVGLWQPAWLIAVCIGRMEEAFLCQWRFWSACTDTYLLAAHTNGSALWLFFFVRKSNESVQDVYSVDILVHSGHYSIDLAGRVPRYEDVGIIDLMCAGRAEFMLK